MFDSLMLNVALTVFLWWACGVFNIAIVQAFSPIPDIDFGGDERARTLAILYGLAPFVFVSTIIWFILIKPIQYGTLLGRWIGRRLASCLD